MYRNRERIFRQMQHNFQKRKTDEDWRVWQLHRVLVYCQCAVAPVNPRAHVRLHQLILRVHYLVLLMAATVVEAAATRLYQETSPNNERAACRTVQVDITTAPIQLGWI